MRLHEVTYIALIGLALGFATVAISPVRADNPVPADIRIPAIIVAEDETVLSSSMSGHIDKMPVDEGDRFKRNDVLVRFKCDILDGERAVARASVKGAEAKLENAKRLDQLGVSGTLDYQLAQSELDIARAELQVANAKGELCEVRAPFDGLVLRRDVQEHENVNTMTPLLKIARSGTVNVAIIAPAQWLSWVNVSMPFEFTPNGGSGAATGKVTKVGGEVDAASQTVKIEGVLSTKGQLLIPGMGGTVYFSPVSGEKGAGEGGRP